MLLLLHNISMLTLNVDFSCLQCGEKVTVSIAASFLMKTPELNSFLQHIPDWVASSATTTFQSSWSF